MPHGFDDELWDDAKEQAKCVLAECAARRKAITYSELAHRINAITFEPNDPRFNRWFLRDISVEEDADNRGMLTVIVVHKGGDMQPGPGFYELAKELGRDVADIDACWIREFNRVCDVWGSSN